MNLIFYLGHTATFFINKLVLAKLMPERSHAGYTMVQPIDWG